MTENNKKMQAAWTAAMNQPGTPQLLGRIVVCDGCNGDWTDRTESGGLLVGSYAHCPACEAKVRADLKHYYREEYLALSCPPEMSFADWVRAMRGPKAHIKVTMGKLPRL